MKGGGRKGREWKGCGPLTLGPGSASVRQLANRLYEPPPTR